MTNQMLYFSAGIIGITAMLLMGIGFLKSQPKNPSAQLFFLISLCIVCYIINIMGFHAIDPAFRIDFSGISFLIRWAPNAIPGLFMMFCHRVFQEDKQFPRWLMVVFFIHFFHCALWNYVYDYMSQTPPLFDNSVVNEIGNWLIDLLLLGFTLGGIYWTVKDWRNDLIEGRRILRWLFVGVQGLIIFAVVVSENFIVNSDSSYFLSQQITVYVIAGFSVVMTLLMTNFDYALLSNVIEKVGFNTSTKIDDNDLSLDLDDFNRGFIEQKLYREPGLTIANLSDKLAIPEYRLRSLINKHLGYRNFNAMLHFYRVEDASQTLADRKHKNIPILTIALDVGYQSITPFNTAFRNLKGLTPSEFRKQHLSNQSAVSQFVE